MHRYTVSTYTVFTIMSDVRSVCTDVTLLFYKANMKKTERKVNCKFGTPN